MRDGFCGWYFKCRGESGSLAVIAAAHAAGGAKSGSVQVITEEGCRAFAFGGKECFVSERAPRAVLGGSVLNEKGMLLDLKSGAARVCGRVRFGSSLPLRYDIMGPLALVPGPECRHAVASMRHTVNGRLWVDGREYRFEDGAGYIEGDRGRSFPGKYIWTQSEVAAGSVMLAAGRVPLGPVSFDGVTAAAVLGGREYRLASYLGARLVKAEGGEAVVRQGRLELSAAAQTLPRQALRAPVGGRMERMIRENVACRVRYRLKKGGEVLLEEESRAAAFEWEW